MIIDAHLHLDDTKYKSAHEAAAALDLERENVGISHCIVLHLLYQNWSMEEFAEALQAYPKLHGLVNLNPSDENCIEQMNTAIDELGYIGLKLHPRLQEFSIDHEDVRKLVSYCGEKNVPVLIDGFPDGTHLQRGFNAMSYANLALACPDTNIIIGHMGGHYVFDFMMLAKRILNIYFDISYSFLYYRGSSVPSDMIYAMQSMKFDRIFYGSDYPDRSLKETLEGTLEIFNGHGVEKKFMDKILFQNATEFFKI